MVQLMLPPATPTVTPAVLQLTPAGKRQFRRMAATHEQWVIELLAGWSPADKTEVQSLLGRLKQHLAAIRMLFDWLVTGQVIAMNPASSVRGPKHVVKRGKTPVLDADQARQLLDSIDSEKIAGLRDRALIAVIGLDWNCFPEEGRLTRPSPSG